MTEKSSTGCPGLVWPKEAKKPEKPTKTNHLKGIKS